MNANKISSVQFQSRARASRHAISTGTGSHPNDPPCGDAKTSTSHPCVCNPCKLVVARAACNPSANSSGGSMGDSMRKPTRCLDGWMGTAGS